MSTYRLLSTDAYLRKKSNLLKNTISWSKHRLSIDSDGLLCLVDPNQSDQPIAQTRLSAIYRLIRFRPTPAAQRPKFLASSRPIDSRYSLVIPFRTPTTHDDQHHHHHHSKIDRSKEEMTTLGFESIDELSRWLRLFVSILGGRQWIARLIPDSDRRWKIDAAVGYSPPFDTDWPEHLERWPMLWAHFRTCYILDSPKLERPIKNTKAQIIELKSALIKG